MERPYNFEMGIIVDNTPLPDPAKWGYQVGDLDTSGKRDATGRLHRAYVSTKINHEFQWNGLGWQMLNTILQAVNKPIFRLTAPDPRDYSTPYTGDYYVGDRTGEANYIMKETDEKGVFSLKLKFIEY